jgi:hypothetical protein
MPELYAISVPDKRELKLRSVKVVRRLLLIGYSYVSRDVKDSRARYRSIPMKNC